MLFLSKYIEENIPDFSFGICHGTRRGLEQKWFQESLGGEVIGTEISDTAKDFEKTIQWDFHEENPEWVGKADFVYSNSWDHAYDPGKAISTWMRSLSSNGICILEHTSCHEAEHTSTLDPFGASRDALPYLILEWSDGKYSVREILVQPSTDQSKFQRRFFILKNNS